MKCANAPGSISTFFLYQGEASANDEVDIEIFEDRQYMMDLTTWVGGEATNHDRRVLAFDPTAEFHEYAISYHHKWISFYIDGRLHLTWTARLPTGRMKIVSNAWWPTWLSGPKPTADIHARVDSIRHLASRA
jgi:beta-glucanase (GH16 family)